jgi:hypothetical protein
MRALSNLVILCGLGIAGLGLESVWTSWHSQTVAEQQWDRQIADRPSSTQQTRQSIGKPQGIAKGEMLARLSIDRLDYTKGIEERLLAVMPRVMLGEEHAAVQPVLALAG